MKFSDIPGHDDAKRRLREMADSGRIPHALLLEGPAGAGKFMLARAFASYIHCADRHDGDSCGCCPACRQADSFGHLDTIYSFPVLKRSGKPALSDDYLDDFKDFITKYPYMDFDRWLEAMDNINGQPLIYVEEGNELLRRLTFKTRGSKFKTVLMWLPERLQEATANKLLKLVEEAFADTVFIMVSNSPRRILPTIYSRVQRVTVSRYSDTETAAILTAGGIDATTAADAARIAAGNVNEALRLAMCTDERLRLLDLFTTLMRNAYGRRVADLRKWSLAVADLGREPAMGFIDYATRLLRESFLMHLADERLLTLNSAERAFLIRFFPFINEKNVEDLIALFDAARIDIAGNANAKIVFFDLAVRTIILLRRNG
ncbi:MAG: ATP-binding protein [Muribaculaceae bacterium]|nr:ATP-binding protein [Muribaculaceae bacterium]